MRKLVLVTLVMATSVAGCASVNESRYNPFNWFGRSSSAPVAAPADAEVVNPLIPSRRSVLDPAEEPEYTGTLVQEVSELHIRRVPGGAVIEVTGVFHSIGSYDVELVREEEEDTTVLSFSLRAVQPTAGRGWGNAHVRSVTAATNVTDQDLAGISTIKVIAENNVRTARR